MAPSAADVERNFTVTAAADAVRIRAVGKNFLLVENLLDLGVPSAQAELASSGNSTAFAGHPYPGEDVLSVPGIARGAAGEDVAEQGVPPDYPLYAWSRHPQVSESKVEQPGYALLARSDESSSQAKATSGLEQDGSSVARLAATAMSVVDSKSGKAEAAAESVTEGLTINGVLTLGRVVSSASVRVDDDGKVTRSSNLAIAETTVAGQTVAITPRGVEAAGQPSALPPSDQINDALKDAGVEVRYLAPSQQANGVVSAGVEILAQQQDPTGGPGTFVVHYVLGRTTAYAATSQDGAGDLPVLPPADDSQPQTGVASVDQTSEAAATTDLGPQTAPAVPGPADPPPAVAPAGDVALAGARVLGDAGAVGLYLVVVVAAGAAFAGGTLFRLVGVKSRWTS